jgi:hypothetical protein
MCSHRPNKGLASNTAVVGWKHANKSDKSVPWMMLPINEGNNEDCPLDAAKVAFYHCLLFLWVSPILPLLFPLGIPHCKYGGSPILLSLLLMSPIMIFFSFPFGACLPWPLPLSFPFPTVPLLLFALVCFGFLLDSCMRCSYNDALSIFLPFSFGYSQLSSFSFGYSP